MRFWSSDSGLKENNKEERILLLYLCKWVFKLISLSDSSDSQRSKRYEGTKNYSVWIWGLSAGPFHHSDRGKGQILLYFSLCKMALQHSCERAIWCCMVNAKLLDIPWYMLCVVYILFNENVLVGKLLRPPSFRRLRDPMIVGYTLLLFRKLCMIHNSWYLTEFHRQVKLVLFCVTFVSSVC